MEKLLELKNVWASTNNKQILKGLSLVVNKGETHVIMGPNGAGKTTFSNVVFSNPAFKKEKGKILFEGEDITSCTTDEIARKGVFLSFQLPVELEGISTFNFIKTAKNSAGKKESVFELKKEIEQTAINLDMPKNMLNRDLNLGFSGGEKKKNEILQLLSLNPKLAILDETDSGLDVDAIKIVSKGINMFKNNKNAVVIITHSSKILQSLKVDKVHILVGGKIVKSGGPELIAEIEKNGYSKFKDGE